MTGKSIIRITLCLFLMLLSVSTFAKNYYFSSSEGDDSRTVSQAQSQLTPWKSLDKLNQVMSLINGGDSVLFKRGDVFSGSIVITKSGPHVASRIVFGAYGKGPLPEISGLAEISDWTEVGDNIWKAACRQCGLEVTNLLIDGTPAPMGRYPNRYDADKQYLKIISHTGKKEITGEERLDVADWTGAEAVVRSKRWILDRSDIASQHGRSLAFLHPLTYEAEANFGFFIQNHPKTLDEENEWYYSPNTREIFLHAASDPGQKKIQVSIVSNLISVTKRGFIEIENLSLTGASKNAINIDGGFGISIRNCQITNSGTNGITAYYSNRLSLSDNYFNNTLNNAIDFNYCTEIKISGNTIKNTALFAGMGSGGNGQYIAMDLSGENYEVTRNRIDSVGYLGIYFWCEKVLIKNNFISNFCLVKDDGGGIYTYSDGSTDYKDQQIIGNIIVNGSGAPHGTPSFDPAVSGIYLDDRSNHLVIADNTVIGNSFNGVYIRNSHSAKVFRNKLISNGTQLRFLRDSATNTQPIANCEVADNLFLSTLPAQRAMHFSLADGGISDVGRFDRNYYYRATPDDLDVIAKSYSEEDGGDLHVLSFQQWQQKYRNDINSISRCLHAGSHAIKLLSPNLIRNRAIFGWKHWHCWSLYDNCEIEADSSNTLFGRALNISFKSFSKKPDSKAHIISNFFSINRETKCMLYFSAKSSAPGTGIVAHLKMGEEPYSLLTEEAYFKLDTATGYFQHVFSISTDVTRARLEFELMESPGTVRLSDVELYEAEVDDPEANILLKYNAGDGLDFLTADRSYSNYTGEPCTGQVTLEPFSSVVLIGKTAPSAVHDIAAFELVGRSVSAKVWESRFYLTGGIVLLFLFAVYYIRRRKRFSLAVLVVLLLPGIAAGYFLQNKNQYTASGRIALEGSSITLNDKRFPIATIRDLVFDLQGYDGQQLLEKDITSNGCENFIRFKADDDKEVTGQFRIGTFKELVEIKRLISHWQATGHDVRLR